MISIIIPAHNEENVIGRCLSQLLEGIDEGGVEVIVVCNGCTDRTAQKAREAHKAIKVIESSIPSKIAALNEGDRLATGFPRVYLDADIVTNWPSVKAVAAELESGACLAAAPRMRINLDDRNIWVRSYYRLWLEVPYFKEGMLGCGFYALSHEGRERFVSFPSVTADDEFVRRLFLKHERKTVETGWFVMTPPKTIAGVIKINTRAIFGNLELAKVSPPEIRDEKKDFGPFLRKMAFSPSFWFPLGVYSAVRLLAIAAARKRIGASQKTWAWDRDDTSRE